MSRSLLILVVLAAVGVAQNPTASVVGTLRDPTGAFVPGASVKIRNIDTNALRQASSGENGEFTIPNLNPGRYEVVVEKPGFSLLRETGVELQVEQAARLDLVLQVGSVSEAVEVKADVPLLNTESGVRGDVIVTQEIVEMPLDGRSVADLAFLVPGVTPSAQGSIGSGFNIGGTRGDNANFLVDGFNNRRSDFGQMLTSPNLDAIQEFKMETGNYSAQYGKLAGGIMSVALKSGTNVLHGSLFEFVRNDQFDARNFFDQQKHKLRRNQFGGGVNGPVVVPWLFQGRDRTFFLFSWESYRQVQGNTQLSVVPALLERAGNFSQSRTATGAPVFLKDPLLSGACGATSAAGCFSGNVIPASRISPIAAAIEAYYPLPNRPGPNNYVTSAVSPNSWDSFLTKIDHRLGVKDNLSARMNTRANHTSVPFDSGSLGLFGSVNRQRDWIMGATETRMFAPTLINEFRAGFSRSGQWEQSNDATVNYQAQLGLPVTNTNPVLFGFPLITVSGLPNLGDNTNRPYSLTVNTYQYGDTVTWVRGRHQVRFGGEAVRSQQFQPFYQNIRGTYAFTGNWTSNAFADFLLGTLNSASRVNGEPQEYLFSTNYGLFVQDDFKVGPRLTLNLGMRWEMPVPMVDKYGRLSNFVPQYRKIILAGDTGVTNLPQVLANAGLAQDFLGLAKDYGLPPALTATRYNRVAPRLGFAWRPFSGNRTVLRGGYGIFYGADGQGFLTQQLAQFFPFYINQNVTLTANNPLALTLANPFGNATRAGGVSYNGFDTTAPPPYIQSYNLTVERQLGSSSALEVSYSGTKGTHLGRLYDLNQPYFDAAYKLPNGSYPAPYVTAASPINYFAFGTNSIYSAGTVTLRRRLAKGFFYRLNYVYSKSIDDSSQVNHAGNGGFPGAESSRNLRLERARSDWDRGHVFTMNYSYQLPWNPAAGWSRIFSGWQLAGTGQASTGPPFTPIISGANPQTTPAARPNRTAGGKLSNPGVARWYDLTAFPQVPAGVTAYGTSGRNILDGPGTLAMNLSLIRNMSVGDRGRLQFRWEVFNAFNRANFGLPVTGVNAANAGTIVSAGTGRSMQFALRLQM